MAQGGENSEGAQDPNQNSTNSLTSTSPRRDADNSRDGTTIQDPFSDASASDNSDSTINDDSWSSTATIHPLERMSDTILRPPGTPGSAIDPLRAGTPRRFAASSTSPSGDEDPFATPHGERVNTPGRERRNPFNSPLHTPSRREPSGNDDVSSSARRAATNTLLALPPPRQTVSPSSAVTGSRAASSSGFRLRAPPPPRRPDQAHIEERGRRGGGLLVMRGRGSTDYAMSGGRDESRSTMNTLDTRTTSGGPSSRPTTAATGTSTAPPSRQTTAESSGGRTGRRLEDRTLASPFPDEFTAADDTFRSPNRERTASIEGVKGFDLDGKKRGLLGSLGRKASRVFTNGSSAGPGSSPTSVSGDAKKLLGLFAGKPKSKSPYAGPSTELKPFPSDMELAIMRRRPSAPVAGSGMRMPSGGLGYGLGGYSATLGSGFGAAGMGGRSPNMNKPLPPDPPREEEESDEQRKGRGGGKGKEK